MCGICGFTGATATDVSILKSMCDIMAHRGPDGEGQYIADGVAFGHRRLSLIDLEGGNQPMVRATDEQNSTVTSPAAEGDTYSTGDFVIVFNGEIYNYQDLRVQLEAEGYTFQTNSDTEVLLVSYIAWGEALLDRIRGMFAFAILDRKKEELFCARDFFGIKPFYYTQAQEHFIFASEIKSILAHPAVGREVNPEALEQYLSFQYSVLPETFFKGIYKLAPGHCMTVKQGQEPQIKRYWQMDYAIDETLSPEAARDAIHDAVQDSVKYHMVADVEVASFLSSGVDSNYLTASLHAQGGNIKTFTVGFETADGDKYNETAYAKQASDYLGVENYSHVIGEDEFWNSLDAVQWHMDEPSADPAAVALYFVDKEAATKVKAVLSGEGSDEFFGGYTIYQTPLENAKLSWCPRPILKAGSSILSALGIRGANYLHRASTPLEQQFIGNANMFSVAERTELLKQTPSAVTPQDLTAPYYKQVANLDEVTRMQYIDMNFWLIGDILLKTDKMSMAHSLESRVPFLDKEVWNVARTLPTSRKVSLETTKIALRRAAEKLLPKQFCEKRKLGFPVPTRVWLKQDKYYNRVKEAFLSPCAEQYFNTDKLVKLLDDHRADITDNSRKIWTVYMFLVWHKVYFE
ncbi:MAG: asparagine synthase (glutamine-hydrolyzing), partial [Raoultibacter sp.]